MKNFTKTFLFTAGLSLATIIIAAFVQFFGQKNIIGICSYLDPAVIDLLAFATSLFLVLEGSYRIHEHVNAPLKKQLTRSIRIAFGFAIITLHTIQIFYK